MTTTTVIAATTTVIAATTTVIAALSYWLARRDSYEEQASRVSVVTEMRPTEPKRGRVRVINDSDRQLFDVWVAVPHADRPFNGMLTGYHHIPANSCAELAIRFPPTSARVMFRDARGRWWVRHESGHLRRLRIFEQPRVRRRANRWRRAVLERVGIRLRPAAEVVDGQLIIHERQP